jgi:Tol biopolymer transport system component
MGAVTRICAVACAGAALAVATSDAGGRSLSPISVGYRPQVFVAKRSGGVRRLTGGPVPHYRPVWSRRGARIAMSAGRDVAILSLDGRVRHEIRGGTSGSGPVAWSPDDRRIAFVSYHRHGKRFHYDGNLVVADVDGGHRRVIARHADGQPDWSSDGTTVFYRLLQSSGDRPTSIWAVSSHGGAPRRLATGVASDSRVLVSPAGTWILFARFTGTPHDGLWVVPTGGGPPRTLVTRAYFQIPSYGWTAGGRAIFGGKRHRTHPILTTLDREHRALRASFYSSRYELDPAGRWVAWFRESGSIHASRADGRGERAIARFTTASNTIDLDTLSWSPDGRRVVIEASRHSGD